MSAALPAFLLEAVFYLGSIFEETRTWFRALRPPRLQALLLWVSALLPYFIFCSLSGTLQPRPFAMLAGLTAVVAYWYFLLPRRWAYDFGFLVVIAAPVILRVFARIYISADPTLQSLRIGDALGHLMWIRLSIAALLMIRGWDPGSVSFWPRASEWKTGTLWFAIAVVPLCILALGIGMVRWEPLQEPWWRSGVIILETFFGVLWVVALSEELFFRGVIERAFLNAKTSPTIAVLISAVLYGVSHLWYRGFPNWREAIVTTALGIACGVAYLQTGSIRAPMVTHAFAAVTVRALFRYT
jgi:uncharacterized protein